MFVLIMLLSVVFWGTVLYLGVRLVRALEYRSRQGGDLTAMTERLARLEAAVGALTTDVDRIEEGQRFTTRLLSEQHRPPPPPAD
jgi:hypothetical protein